MNSKYETAERKIIYVQTADNKKGNLDLYNNVCKIGDASIDTLEIDATPNSDDLRKAADDRIKEYMGTSGIPYKILWVELAYVEKKHSWFRDYDVHNVLKRSGIKKSKKLSGNEWYDTDVSTVKKAIKAVKDGRNSIDSESSENSIQLRPEQLQAIKMTEKVFKNDNKMLWGAKMRFGKTLTSLSLIKKIGFKKVLIITHRPVVDDEWYKEFNNINMSQEDYFYGSRNNGESFEFLKNKSKYIYFASLQDLRGSQYVYDSGIDKNYHVFNNKWDLVIIDEAHEGTQTEIGQKVLEMISEKNEQTKFLSLSGTPFNIQNKYSSDNTYTWDYVMEQTAKNNWERENPGTHNPYAKLPKVNMFTFEMKNKFKQFTNYIDKSFNFNEFFKVNDNGNFKYEREINSFLDNITNYDEKTQYPFSTLEYRNRLRHTLWILPGIRAACALEKLMNKHKVFGKEYKIVNVVDNGDDVDSYGDVERVNSAIGNDPSKSKTITLTVRKLTTGVTVKPWTGVMFLSNMTSSMQYLQAAFRAQTPYESEKFGMKTNCYIFDFAPDRALTIMSAAANFNSGAGKKNNYEQRMKLDSLLNFLPILGEHGNGMKKFDIDDLLIKLKKAYAERAVSSGFDDDSIYNDSLFTVTEDDIEDFKELRSILSKAKVLEKGRTGKININDQGLTDEDNRKADNGEKKSPRDRSPEEKAAMKKRKELLKNRRAFILILRGISVRIPIMIYGMNKDFDEKISVTDFVNIIDDDSWKEFMPVGVTKDVFRKYSKYYDVDIFIEAGNIIRQKTKALDDNDPLNRMDAVGRLFSTFRNPDKETVLTPWNIVNKHLSSTLGGYTVFGDNSRLLGSELSPKWIESDLSEYYDNTSKFLEINSKTGLYPLYVASSIYYKKLMAMNERNAGNFSFKDQLKLWDKIIKNNIFVIAKTPMAREITKRTLCGYRNVPSNVIYENILHELNNDVKQDYISESKRIKEVFNVMKFDVIIGNPPYQVKDNNSNNGSAKPIYQKFIKLAKELRPDIISFITPSVWFLGGKGLDGFRKEMLNDNNMQSIHNFLTPKDVFPSANLRGGVSYFVINKNYDNANKGIYVEIIKNNKVVESGYRPYKLYDSNLLIISVKQYGILKKMIDNGYIKIDSKGENPNMFMSLISSRNPFKFKNGMVKHRKKDDNNNVKVYDGRGKIFYTSRDSIITNSNWVDKNKILTPFANNIGTDLNDDNISVVFSESGSASTETYLVIGGDSNFSNNQRINISKYLKTKFVRFLISAAKANQNGTRKTYLFVPNQDFSESSDINWSLNVSQIDNQLYKKYDLTSDETDFIEENIKPSK